jgi:hypothetical protein
MIKLCNLCPCVHKNILSLLVFTLTIVLLPATQHVLPWESLCKHGRNLNTQRQLRDPITNVMALSTTSDATQSTEPAHRHGHL